MIICERRERARRGGTEKGKMEKKRHGKRMGVQEQKRECYLCTYIDIVCECVCIDMYMYVCIYVYTYVYIYTYT